MKVPFLNLKKEWQYFEQDFVKVFKEFGHDAYYVLGPTVEKFEKEFATYCGYKFAASVSSGLAALETALLAYSVGKGDEVITVANSAVATALAISTVGARPIFCDVGDDFLLDVNKLEGLINGKTKAILPVHLFGQVCDMAVIHKIAKKYNLIVIEDACQAHGSVFKSESARHTKAFSFYPTKNLGALGEGGMVVTNDKKVRDFISIYRDYGQQGRYNHVIKGNNYRLDGLHCALLSVKLKKLNESVAKKRKVARKYCAALKGIKNLKINPYDKNCSYHLFVVRVLDGQRARLKDHLDSAGIQTLIHYPTAIHRQPCYKKEYKNLTLPNTDKFQEEILSLPCHPYLRDNEVDFVIKKILSFYGYGKI